MTHPLRSRAVVVDDDNLVMVQFVLNKQLICFFLCVTHSRSCSDRFDAGRVTMYDTWTFSPR